MHFSFVVLCAKNYKVIQAKRLRRAAKFMKSEDALFWLVLTLAILSPLHSLMSTLFRVTGRDNYTVCMISGTEQAINSCVTALCSLLFDVVASTGVKWGALAALVPVSQKERQLIRRELLRVLGGIDLQK